VSVSYSSVIVITELNRTDASSIRVVTLVGPSLPLMGAEWSGENELTTTWYPGNGAEGTQQNLGPKELPSAWQGDWRRTMMGGTPAKLEDFTSGLQQDIVDPSILRDTLESMFRDGRRLRVTWAVQQQPDGQDQTAYPITGNITREGRAKTWKFKHTSIHDIEWDITFEWVSRGATTPRVASTRDDTLAQTSAPYVAAIRGLIDATQAAETLNLAPTALSLGLLEGVSSGPVTQMSATAQDVAALQDDLLSIAAIGSSLPNQPIQIAQAALSHAADALQRSDATYMVFSATPLELTSANDDAVSCLRAFAILAPVQDAALVAEIQAYTFYQAMRAALPTHSGSLQGRNSAKASPSPKTILDVYRVVDGDTPQKISMRYYGVPDHSADIMRANGLSWHTPTLPKGKQLIIPVISSSTQTV
jgi:phage tail protein X